MLLPIYILSVVFSFALPKNKGYFVYLILLGFIVFALNSYTVDRTIYENRYTYWDEDFLLDTTEPLYTFLIKTMNSMGCTYQTFIGVHATLFLFSVYSFIKKQTKRPTFVLALFFIGAFMHCVCIMRITLAFAVQLFAISLILKNQQKISDFILYVSITLIAMSIHSSCIVFLIFLIVFFIEEKTIARYTIPAFIILSLSVVTLKHFLLTFHVEKVEMVYEDMEAGGSVIVVLLLAIIRYLSCLAIVMVPYKYFKGYKNDISKKVLSINYIMFALMPLLYITHDFGRLTYIIFMINICEMSKMIKKKNDCAVFLFLASLNFGYWSYIRPFFTLVFVEPLCNNLLFD
ncbi:MAG: EpsG family protein [Paludibacteraceae bacterium]|nr:EpsG family protein [Paludibacteraceae bacterium]